MESHQVKVVFKYYRVPGYQMEITISDNEYATMKDNPKNLDTFMKKHSTGTISSVPPTKDHKVLPSLILFIKERDKEEYVIHTIEREMMNVEPILADKHVRTNDRRVVSLEFSAIMRPLIIVNVPTSLQNRVLKKDKGAITKTLAQRLRRFDTPKKLWSLQLLCDKLHFTKIVISEHYLPLNFTTLNEGVEVGIILMTPKQTVYPEQRKSLGSFPDNWYDL
jgi:hypothetical protein